MNRQTPASPSSSARAGRRGGRLWHGASAAREQSQAAPDQDDSCSTAAQSITDSTAHPAWQSNGDLSCVPVPAERAVGRLHADR
jgi:hypothetical protein